MTAGLRERGSGGLPLAAPVLFTNHKTVYNERDVPAVKDIRFDFQFVFLLTIFTIKGD